MIDLLSKGDPRWLAVPNKGHLIASGSLSWSTIRLSVRRNHGKCTKIDSRRGKHYRGGNAPRARDGGHCRKATERGIGSPSCGTRPTPTTAGPWRCATAPTRRIGYVSCECNEFVARLIDGGKSVEGRLTDKEQIGSWTRLVMEVVLND